MTISVDCLNCGKTLKAKDAAAGKTAKCPGCGELVKIPQIDEVYDAEDDYGSLAGSDDLPMSMGDDQKPCPMCGEFIASVAKKCRHCGEILDPALKKKKKKRTSSSDDEEMTAVDWVLCILCPGIGCIVGIIRAIQGNTTGVKMIGISVGMSVFWNVISSVLKEMARQ